MYGLEETCKQCCRPSKQNGDEDGNKQEDDDLCKFGTGSGLCSQFTGKCIVENGSGDYAHCQSQ